MTNSKNAVLITGANGGIGQALCRVFLEAEYYVIASDQIRQDCDCDQYIEADLRLLVKEQAYRTAFFNEIDSFLSEKELKGLVNNAAIQTLDPLDDMNIDDFQHSMDVNVVAPLILIKELRHKLDQASGSVVNIGSIHTKLTKPGFVSYASSKSALTGLSQSLAVDLGNRFRINVIQPAATQTEMLIEGFSDNPALMEELKRYHPLKRLAYPEEIANAALFLVSDKSGFITGTTINIDGGIGCRLHDPV